ncbi:hypothetical protein DICSQDRAFT_146480 [Dichomitus squalens LYAD-421 SS1]|uniref:methionine--tRNA ligase n=1 Tax=Dichomitus squalens (strain LYAD-421) TaxID=732165 RepID=R7T1J0_DICSQ|nr:uncharacterized protein DICSQDRAFT_146480 [Dichomitus squalens LYAD-421 SS1]EJF62201.1 hypothetical protein DICSQDRAFT_146480 [Dichomitus squalens LYAD-421 SS1]
MDPQEFVDELSVHFRNLTKKANISNTHFTRTTSKQHIDAVQHLWKELEAKGYIYKGRHEGWYSVSDETFIPEKQIEGSHRTQKDGAVEHTDERIFWYSEENYMFRLSAFPDHIYEYYAARGADAIHPHTQASDVHLMLKGMMHTRRPSFDDLSISRPRSRLSWGIPVPGDPEQTIYVWIDALAAYLTSVGYPWSSTGGDGTAAGWPPDLQVIGKDIIRFHTLYFPAMLQALGLPLPVQLLSHAHWTVERAKMSKSVGNVADPIKAIDDFGIDLVRYYLARVGGRFQDDVDWSQKQLQKHSREIISLLGNLFMRATSDKLMGKVSTVKPRELSLVSESQGSEALLQSLKTLAPKFDVHLREFELATAVEAVVAALSEANALMTQAAPWARETSPSVAADIQALVFETLRQSGILLQPIMPDTATLLLDSLGVPKDQRTIADAVFGRSGVGEVRPGVRLFDMGSLKLRA